MTTPYRELSLVLPDQQPRERNVIRYIDKPAGTNNCPACNGLLMLWAVTNMVSVGVWCVPERRVVLRGHWWWRKRCTLGGVHRHYTCPICGVHLIEICVGEDKEKTMVLGGTT